MPIFSKVARSLPTRCGLLEPIDLRCRPFPPDLMNAAFKASMDLYNEISARNENWRKVYADYAKFRAEQNLWFRFTEATFDRYMQSAKL